ncbi:MAG: TIGR03621 family F420-dependent LLM class oxidoreductase [Thermomicrobiales bacterium]
MSTSPRPFRFGVQIARVRSAAEWREQARRAEALGYDVFLMPDHFGAQFAIGPALAVVAEATSRIRIGTLVWQNDLRHPALVAKEAATLDVLSEGRFELGIGAGGSFLPEYEWTGIPFNSPGKRVGRLEESVRIIKGAFSPEPVTFSGEYFQFDGYQGYPKPSQQPTPPFLIAGGGKRMLGLAAREADIVGLLPSMKPAGGSFYDDDGVEAFASKAAFVRAEAGERAAAIEFNILVQMVKVTDDRAGAIEHLRKEHELEDPSWFESPMVYVGSVDEIVEKLRAMREQVGASYFVVFEPVMEEFAPVVAHLSGR